MMKKPEREPVVIRTPVGDIAIKADPTLKPGEWYLEQPRPSPNPWDDCRAKADSNPHDVCPVCRAWLLLRGTNIEACADPLCKGAHGVRVDWRGGRAVIEVRDVSGQTWSEL